MENQDHRRDCTAFWFAAFSRESSSRKPLGGCFFKAASLWREQEGQPMRSRRGSCPELPRKKNLLAGLFVVLLLFLLLLLHLSFFLLFLCCFFFLGVVLRRVLRVGRAGNTQERCERQST